MTIFDMLCVLANRQWAIDIRQIKTNMYQQCSTFACSFFLGEYAL
jgi:hypothetical protein